MILFPEGPPHVHFCLYSTAKIVSITVMTWLAAREAVWFDFQLDTVVVLNAANGTDQVPASVCPRSVSKERTPNS